MSITVARVVVNASSGRIVSSNDPVTLISQLTPSSSASTLEELTDVSTSGKANGYFLVYNSGNSTWIAAAGGGLGYTVNVSSSPNTIPLRDSNSDIFANNFWVTSDIRLKDNISYIIDPISIVKKMDGRIYTYKESNTIQYGFIAQELEETMPELVEIMPNKFKTVNYNNIIAILVESIKKLSEEIDILKGNHVKDHS